MPGALVATLLVTFDGGLLLMSENHNPRPATTTANAARTDLERHGPSPAQPVKAPKAFCKKTFKLASLESLPGFSLPLPPSVSHLIPLSETRTEFVRVHFGAVCAVRQPSGAPASKIRVFVFLVRNCAGRSGRFPNGLQLHDFGRAGPVRLYYPGLVSRFSFAVVEHHGGEYNRGRDQQSKHCFNSFHRQSFDRIGDGGVRFKPAALAR